MKIFAIITIACLITSCSTIENFNEDQSAKNVERTTLASIIMHPGSVSPIIVPAQTIQTGGSPCYSGNCNYYPSLCNSGCQQQQQQQQYQPQYQNYYNYPQQLVQQPKTQVVKVPVPVQKVVPEKITRTFPMQPTIENIPMESETLSICPVDFESIEDENDQMRCVQNDDTEVICPQSFEWQTDRCIATKILCPNEYFMSNLKCTPRIMCPPNYHQSGNKCVPPTPICPTGWRWNHEICEAERITCPSGYSLTKNNECIHETYTCPHSYRKFGNQCVKDEPSCPSHDYIMNKNTNVCEKIVNKCPAESYEQYGQCVATKYVCPVGSKTVGDMCTVEETSYKTVHEM